MSSLETQKAFSSDKWAILDDSEGSRGSFEERPAGNPAKEQDTHYAAIPGNDHNDAVSMDSIIQQTWDGRTRCAQ